MTPKKQIEALEAIKDVLKSKPRWIQQYLAQDVLGYTVSSEDPSAVCWCLVGAIEKVCGRLTPEHAAIIKELQKSLPAWADTNLVAYNDSPRVTFLGIRQLLGRTIGRIKREHSL